MRDHVAKGVVLAWGVTCLLGMATLMVGHWYSLPRPSTDDPRLEAAITELRPSDFGGWQLVHFLYVDCGCSRRIIDHLVESERPSGVHETIVLVGDDPALAQRAAEANFSVVVLTPEAMGSRFGVTGTPAFAVTDSKGEVRYVGGYTDRKQGPVIQEREIVRRLQADLDASELPLFGCAASDQLQALLDPLGLKY